MTDRYEGDAPVSVGGLHCIYTDGSFDPVTKRGGWGFVVEKFGVIVAEDRGRIDDGDNTVAELTAVQMALRWIASVETTHRVSLLSDSVHVVRGCNEWRNFWRSNSWRRKGSGGRGRSRQIPNANLWRDIDDRLLVLPHVNVSWCKGHAEIAGNLRADALAREGRNEKFRSPLPSSY